MNDMTVCKVCGERHLIEEWRGVKFYECPETNRFYLIPEVNKSGHTDVGSSGSSD